MKPVCILVGLALVLLAGCGSAGQTAGAEDVTNRLRGDEVIDPLELPDAVLHDTHGQDYRLTSTPTSPVVVVVFGYSRCAPRCSTSPQVLSDALARLPHKHRDRVTALFITVDPHRDTPEVLGEWLPGAAPGLVGLTAPRDTVEQVAAQLGVPVSGKQRNGADGYFVGHGTHIIAFDHTQQAVVTWDQDDDPSDIAHDLAILVEG